MTILPAFTADRFSSPAAAAAFLQSRPAVDHTAVAVLGMGRALPGPAITTTALLKKVEATFGVSVTRHGLGLAEKLGIGSRHVARDMASVREGPRVGDSNPDLAARALQRALKQAELDINDLGFLIGHTATPAQPIPNNTALVVDRMGFTGPYMELRQACTGFANALMTAQAMLRAPDARPIAIVGSEVGSVFFDPREAANDIAQLVNMVQMGDGAAAIILAPDTWRGERLGRIDRGYFGHMGIDRIPGFQMSVGGSNRPYGDGEVLSFAHAFGDVRAHGLDLFAAGLLVASDLVDVATVNRIIPHQANGLMDQLVEAHVGLPGDKIFVEADRIGNTGSAAIWLALAGLQPSLASGQTALVLGAEATKYLFGGFVYEQA